MNFYKWMALVVMVSCSAWADLSNSEKEGLRAFTNENGKVLQARLVKFVEETSMVTIKREDGREFEIQLSTLSVEDQSYISEWSKKNVSPVVAGKVMRLKFPELGMTWRDVPAACEVWIPASYDASKKYPFALWLMGGHGGDSVNGAFRFFDKETTIIAAFPYPKDTPRPLFASQQGKMDEIWAYQKTMLDRILTLIPNTDPRIRIVAGTSNGAHVIGACISDDLNGFCDFFTCYVLREGGGDETGSFRAAKGKNKRVLAIAGEKSTSREYMERMIESLKSSRVTLTSHIVPGEGHGMGDKSREIMKVWVKQMIAELRD